MKFDDPGTPVLVEGPSDKEFISSINSQTIDANLIIDGNGGKPNLFGNMITVTKYVQRLGVLLDIDDKESNDIRTQVGDKLEGNFNQVKKMSADTFLVDNRSAVIVGCAGLHGDNDLLSLNITRNAMEDHILKILLTDDKAVDRISNSTISDSDALLQNLQNHHTLLEDSVEQYSRSKLLCRLASVLLKYEGDLSSFSHSLLQCTSIDLQSHGSTATLVEFLKNVNSTPRK